MEELSIEKFSPAKQELLAIVSETKKTDVTNFDEVKKNRIKLRDTRVMIKEKGKQMREDALKFQKDVIAKEKELIGIIEPEEERLQQIEEEHKLKVEMEKRRDELPSRLEALAGIGDDVPYSENEILAMDDDEFNAYRLRRIDAKLVQDRADLEAAKEKEAIDRIARERVEAEARAKVEREAAEARAKADAEAASKRAQADEQAAVERKVEQDKIDAEKRALEAEKERLAAEERARQKAEAEAREKAELAEREAKALAEKRKEEEKMAKFQAFLLTIQYDNTKDIIEWKDGVAIVYREVGRYQPKE